jgi:hypothetical protein
MTNRAPPCRMIRRTAAARAPTMRDCLLFAGHTGVSTDGGATIYGFNPDGSHIPIWQLMDRLKNGDSFPGIVPDNTAEPLAVREQPWHTTARPVDPVPRPTAP